MRTILIFYCCCMMACVPVPQPPDIPDEKMARIMADMHLAGAATNGMAGSRKDSLEYIYFQQVLQMHQVSQDSYEKNMHLLTQDLGRLKKVLEKSRDMLQDTL